MPEITVDMLVALSGLDDVDRELVVDRCVCGLTLAVLAEREGVSRQAIRNRERRALARLELELIRVGYVR